MDKEIHQTLVDWLLEVHLRYHMLPETIWIAINIDRFLTKRLVSIAKLQLVGITTTLIASKYEEILAPGIEEFVFLTQNAYSSDSGLSKYFIHWASLRQRHRGVDNLRRVIGGGA